MRKRRVSVIEYGDGDGDGNGNGGLSRTTPVTISTTRTKDISTIHHYNHDGEEDIESGPSRITIDDLVRMDRKEGLGQGYSTLKTKSQERRIEHYSATTRRRRRIRTVSATASLALLPTALAAPPPHRPDTSSRSPSASRSQQQQQRLLPRQTESTPPPKPSPSPSTSTSTPSPSSSFSSYESQITASDPSIDEGSIQYGIKYLTSMSTPTQALPTDVYVVDEQRLPFYITQNENGEWIKVDNAWLLYGRQGGDVSTANFGPDDDPSATAVTTSVPSGTSGFSVADNLPPGWGIEATRSDFYRTPLIVAMSVILALMIVAGIIFIVIKRRKEHRRAKRRAARLRRKALAAAGLTEDDLNNAARGGEGVAGGRLDAGLREKLDDIDKTIRPKRREKERGPTALIRTKVKSWNQGILRRRKGKGELGPSRSHTPSIEVIDEDKYDQHDRSRGFGGGRGSSDTERTTPTVASHSTNEQGGGTSGSGSGSGEITTSDSNETPSSNDIPRAATQPPTATYFPPAYRPASVRSLQPQAQSSSRGGSSSSPYEPSGSSREGGSNEAHTSQHGSGGPSPTIVEKTNAPGYYPAPATEDSEVALAVASRSDGKQRMEVPTSEEEEEENRVRHIATDDKQVLERMRMGGSAPPQRLSSEEGTDDAGHDGVVAGVGPSAPGVEVDEHGFERHDPSMLLAPPITEDGPSSSSSSSTQYPRPPQRPNMAYRLYSQDDLAASLGVDERHLLPSAPPPAHPDHLVPSAPPFLDTDTDYHPEGGDEDDDPTPTAPIPSAPAFDLDPDDDAGAGDGGDEVHHSDSVVDGGDEYTRTDTNDTRDTRSDDTRPSPHLETGSRSREEDPDMEVPAGQSRNPSLPVYEP